jgi:hemolysin D
MNIRHRYAAWRELLARYKAVFLHHWRRRDATDGGLFTVQEAEFLPAALSLQERPVSPAALLTARLLMALVLALLLWSWFGKVDIVVNASGKIIPGQRIKTIASVDVASVRALHVVEGQHVKAGDVLVELDASATDAEHDKAIIDRSAAVLQAARSQALLAALDSGQAPRLPAVVPGATGEQLRAEQLHLTGMYRDYQARLARIDGDIKHCEEELPLVTQRAEDFRALLEHHDVAQHAWLEKEQARVDLHGRLEDARHQRAALVAETRRTAYDQLTEGARVAAAAQQDAIRSGEHSRLLKLVAPVDGTVQQLNLHTVGGVVPSAQPLMQVVPDQQEVEVEAMVESRDVGFVEEGQRAEVKVDAFDYTKYGTVGASITHLSRDAVQDEKRGLLYVAKVVLKKSTMAIEHKTVALVPGMAVNVEVKTGERRIIDYVLEPLLQHASEAFHER